MGSVAKGPLKASALPVAGQAIQFGLLGPLEARLGERPLQSAIETTTQGRARDIPGERETQRLIPRIQGHADI